MVLRYAAFTETPEGGNPAGVVLDARELSAEDMQRIAKEVGYSESAFVIAREAGGEYDVRYFSPEAEVPFCGHATIATAVALAQRDGAGDLTLATQSGPVTIRTERDEDGHVTATLTSVAPRVDPAPPADADLADVLRILGWSAADLDPALPPRVAFAGARHLIVAAATRDRLADLDYDFDALKAYMNRRDLTTVDLVHREDPATFH